MISPCLQQERSALGYMVSEAVGRTLIVKGEEEEEGGREEGG